MKIEIELTDKQAKAMTEFRDITESPDVISVEDFTIRLLGEFMDTQALRIFGERVKATQESLADEILSVSDKLTESDLTDMKEAVLAITAKHKTEVVASGLET